jgi:hypothetical protein
MSEDSPNYGASTPRKKSPPKKLNAEEFAFGLTPHRQRLGMSPAEIASFLWGMPVKTYKELEAGQGPELPFWVYRAILTTLGRMRPMAG